MQNDMPHFLTWGRFAERDWEHVFAEFAACGHHEFVVGGRWCLLLEFDPSFPARLKALHHSRYGHLSGSHAPFGKQYDLLAFDEEFIPIARRIHTHLIEVLAGEFGIDTYTMHPLNDFTYRGSMEDAGRHMERTLTPILEVAEKNRVVIAVENGLQYIDRPDVLSKLVRRFDSPYLGCCCDTGHLNIFAAREGISIMEALDMMYSEVVVAHLHDNDGLSDRHWAAGLGNIDWKRFMPKLARAPRMKSMQDEAIHSELTAAELCECTSKLLEYAALPLKKDRKTAGQI